MNRIVFALEDVNQCAMRLQNEARRRGKGWAWLLCLAIALIGGLKRLLELYKALIWVSRRRLALDPNRAQLMRSFWVGFFQFIWSVPEAAWQSFLQYLAHKRQAWHNSKYPEFARPIDTEGKFTYGTRKYQRYEIGRRILERKPVLPFREAEITDWDYVGQAAREMGYVFGRGAIILVLLLVIGMPVLVGVTLWALTSLKLRLPKKGSAAVERSKRHAYGLETACMISGAMFKELWLFLPVCWCEACDKIDNCLRRSEPVVCEDLYDAWVEERFVPLWRFIPAVLGMIGAVLLIVLSPAIAVLGIAIWLVSKIGQQLVWKEVVMPARVS